MLRIHCIKRKHQERQLILGQIIMEMLALMRVLRHQHRLLALSICTYGQQKQLMRVLCLKSMELFQNTSRFCLRAIIISCDERKNKKRERVMQLLFALISSILCHSWLLKSQEIVLLDFPVFLFFFQVIFLFFFSFIFATEIA